MVYSTGWYVVGIPELKYCGLTSNSGCRWRVTDALRCVHFCPVCELCTPRASSLCSSFTGADPTVCKESTSDSHVIYQYYEVYDDPEAN